MSFTLRQLSGQSIGQYELRELYGTGGMGAVYRAYQRNLDRYVAFKVMSLAYSAQQEFVERFKREAKLAASLEHPHIVPIYDYDAMADWQYVVMRLLTGGSLAERIEQIKGRPPSIAEIGTLLQQLSSALDYAHSQNIVHRDIKSNNIMFDTHGTAYLVDFGIAKLIQDNSTRLTADGMTVGTPTHMAPELWTGDDATPASDQYALGIVVYELLTGRVPFNATSPFALMNRHMQETPESVLKYAPHLNGEIDMVLWRALAKEKEERYPSVGAFTRDFLSVVNRTPQAFTGFFTAELRRDLIGTDPAQPNPIIDTPQFSGVKTIAPPSAPSKIPQPPTKAIATNPAASAAQVGAKGQPPQRSAIKSLSGLQRAQAEAAQAPAAPSAIPSPLPTPDLIPVAKPAANPARSKAEVSAAAPKAESGFAHPSEQPVRERIVFVERKEQRPKEQPADGCMTALVESVMTLFGITVSSTVRASIALVLSGVLTLALIVGVGYLITVLLTNPGVAAAFNQLKARLAEIGAQASQAAQQNGINRPPTQMPPPTIMPPPTQMPPQPPRR